MEKLHPIYNCQREKGNEVNFHIKIYSDFNTSHRNFPLKEQKKKKKGGGGGGCYGDQKWPRGKIDNGYICTLAAKQML